MAEQTFAITGIPILLGQTFPTRQEITKWSDDDNNKYQVSLFLRALDAFMRLDIAQKLSYFQIAGACSWTLLTVAPNDHDRHSLLPYCPMG